MTKLYPWLLPTWESWKQNLDQDRLSGSMLLHAAQGMGVDKLLEQFSQAVMCRNYPSEACGFCHSCDLMKSHSHPDVHWIKPEKLGKGITVDQIRQANQLAQGKSHLNGYRLIIIEPAEAMNESASNALLKTLEEPGAQCLFLLVAHQMDKLLPTIVSRCQQWHIPQPQTDVVHQWAQAQTTKTVPSFAASLANHSPLHTLALVEDGEISQYTQLERVFIEQLQQGVIMPTTLWNEVSSDVEVKLNWLCHLLIDTQKYHFGLRDDYLMPGAKSLAQVINYTQTYQVTSLLLEVIAQLSTYAGLNAELIVTNWILQSQEVICS
ncbi:DNA polymerase III subunit delta' [Vibrio sp. 10N.286.49.B3]|uniref:DNA polymerase III subunit delta' n=1 Tax=Vibrio sp. 10N.286.49.B3 TaxID=1880855 RepID=UPI000C81B0FC|nr:DNA polymerase III subunit delta' [Vibrio sp. 10N.286.49.B3]PMH46797.1 DNA polymerase III subunit delta' [Vibrio sp. 10N.286.49.B3]